MRKIDNHSSFITGYTTCNSVKNWAKKGCMFLFFFPQTVWPHWGVLTVTVKAPYSIEVVFVALGIFPVKKSYQMALVKCPCAFRLPRLVQNAGRVGVLRHLLPLQISIRNGSCEMSMCISTAQARTSSSSSSSSPSSSSSSSSKQSSSKQSSSSSSS